MKTTERNILRKQLVNFMEFAINLPDIPNHSTKELVVDEYLKTLV